MREIKIGSRIISRDIFQKPYIIAEIGVNHENDIEKAKLMIKQAKEGGADAVKFQMYKAENLAAIDAPAYWDLSKEKTRSQRELFKKYDKLTQEDYKELFEYCKKLNIDFLCTPFDIDAVDFLDKFVPAFKIASADITNVPLLRKVAKKNKPILLSTGASTISEIWHAIEIIEAEGNNQICLLHCVLNYPTEYKYANIGAISDMIKIFSDYIIGYSDHTLTDRIVDVFVTSWLLGAKIIEKHFTFDKTLPGNDHYHAMDINDLKNVTNKITQIIEIYGEGKKILMPGEEKAREYARRRIVSSCKIKKGDKFSEINITVKRASRGIPSIFYDFIVGKKATKDINEDEIIEWNMVE